MRLVKMFDLAAVAAVAATAFVGATSASAADTQLCLTHDAATALTCDSAATSVAMNNTGQGTFIILNPIVLILCLTWSLSGTPLDLDDPQLVHLTSLGAENCGSKAAHSNCTATTLELSLASVSKTGLDIGTYSFVGGQIQIRCDNIDIFGIDIDCVYDLTGLEFAAGAQHLTADDTAVNFVEGEFLCPEESFLDGLLKTTAKRYILA